MSGYKAKCDQAGEWGFSPLPSAFATNGRRKSANLKISKGGEAGKCIQVEKQLTDDEVTFGGLTAVEL